MALTGKQKQQYEEIKRRRQAQNATTQGARVDTTDKPMPKVLTPDLRAGYDRYLQSLRTPTMAGDTDPRFSGSLQSSTDLGRRYRTANYNGYQERAQREAEQLREGYQKFLLGKHDRELAGVTAPAAQAMEKQRAVVQSGQRQMQVPFYSPNGIYQDLQQKENRLMGMQQGASQYVTRLENAEKALMAGKKNLEALKPGTLEYQAAAGEMEKLWANYQAAYEGYQNWEKDYNREYSALETERVRRLGNWRKTVRAESVIQQELLELEQEIKALEDRERTEEEQARKDRTFLEKMGSYLGMVQDTTLPLGATYAGTGTAPETDAEMQALLAEKSRLQEELEWSRYYKYDPLMASSDFEEKSQYVSRPREKKRDNFGMVMGDYGSNSSPWEDPLYEFVNGNEEAGAYLSNQAAANYGGEGWGAVFGRVSEDKAETQTMTDREIAIFNYIYNTEGKDAAHAYYEEIHSSLTYRQRKAEEEKWARYAAEAPVGASAFSVLMSPAKGLSYLGQTADYLSTGKIDQNAGYNKFSYAGSAIRNQVAQQIEASGKWGKVGSFAYQTGMSMGDFLMTTAVSGGNQILSLAIMGTGAAADTTLAAKERGLSDGKAYALGVAAGVGEILMEKIGLDALFDARLLKRSKLGYILKNALSEGTEEVGSNVINFAADILISGDESQWRKSIEYYMQEFDLTEAEAFGRALADQALSMGEDFLGGFLSGGVMGSGGAAVQQFRESSRVREISQALNEGQISPEFIRQTIETGLAFDPKGRSYKLAEAMQKKVDAGQEITARELGQLWQANEAAIEEGLTYDPKSEIYQRAAELHIREPLRLFEALDRSGDSEAANDTEASERGEARLSIEVLPDGRKYVRADRQVIFGNDPESWREQIESYINGKIRRGEDVTFVAEDGDVLTLTDMSAGKLADRVKGDGTRLSDDSFYRKANAAVHIDELATVSRGKPGKVAPDEDARHGEFASGGWKYRKAYFEDADGKYYEIPISTAIGADGTAIYNIGDIRERSFPNNPGVPGGKASSEGINNADTGSSAPVGGAQRRIISPSGVSVPQDGDASQGKSTSTPGDAELQAAAKKLPELYRKNFLVNGKGVTNVKAYKSAYEAYALAGRIAAQTGKEGFREAEEMYAGGFADILSEEAKTAAYALGKEEGRQEIKGQEAPAKLGSGRLIDEGGLLDNAPGLKKLFELAVKRMHIDLTINDEKGYNGRFIAATMAMALSTNGNLVQSFGHELGEYIGAFAPAEKEMLRKNLIQWWVSHENEKDIDSLARRYQKTYAKEEGQKSYADAMDEIVYDALGALLTTKEGQKGLLRFLQGKKTSEAAMKRTMPEPKKKFLRKLKEWVERIGRGLKAYLAGKKVMPDSQRFLDMELNDRVKLLGEFFQAAERAIENAESGAKVATDAKYSAAIVNTDILHLLERIERGEYRDNEKVYFEKVSDEIAEKIKKLTGIDVRGFDVAIEARQLEHIIKDHGKNGASDRSMADPRDIARMEYVLDSPDSIEPAGKTRAYTYMKDGRNRLADTVLYEKNTGDKTYYVVQAVPDTKRKTLFIVTAFIGKPGYKKGALQLTNANDPSATPKDGSAGTPVITSTTRSNKSQGKNSGERNSLPILPETEEDRTESWEDAYALTAEEAAEAAEIQRRLESGEPDPEGFERRMQAVREATKAALAVGTEITGEWKAVVERAVRGVIRTTNELLEYQYQQGKRSTGRTYEQAVRKVAREFKKEIGTKLPTEELEKGLSHAVAVLASTGDTNKAWVTLKGTVEKAMQQATTEEGSIYGQYEEARKYFRKNTIVITKADAADIPDFYDLRKRNTGRMLTRTTENRAEATLDMDWEEICGLLSGLVDPDTRATSDKLLAIEEALNTIYTNKEVPLYSPMQIQEEVLGRTASLLNELATMEFKEVTIEDRRLAGLVEDAQKADQEAKRALRAGRTAGIWETRKAVAALEMLVRETEKAGVSDERMVELVQEAKKQIQLLDIRAKLSSANTDEAYMEVLRMVERESKKREAELYHAQERLEMAEGRFVESLKKQREAHERKFDDYKKWSGARYKEFAAKVRTSAKAREVSRSAWRSFKELIEDVLDDTKSNHVPAMARKQIADFLLHTDLFSYGLHKRNEDSGADRWVRDKMEQLADVVELPDHRDIRIEGDTLYANGKPATKRVGKDVVSMTKGEIQKVQRELGVLEAMLTKGKELGKTPLYAMSLEQLQELTKVLQQIKSSNYSINQSLYGFVPMWNTRDLRKTVIRKVQELMRLVTDNSKSHHVPAMLRQVLAEFLGSIDILSKQSHEGGDDTHTDAKVRGSMEKLLGILNGEKVDSSIGDMVTIDGVVLDLPPSTVQLLAKELKKVNEAMDKWREGDKTAVYQMDIHSLENLNEILTTLKHAIVNANEYLSGERGTTMDESAGLSVEEFEATKPKLVESGMDAVQNKYSWESALPAYAFARLGKGAKAVWDCLVEGWEKLAQHAKEIKDFSESTFKHWEVKQWETAERTFITERGETIYLTDAHIMGLVTEFKRKQARDHITQGGVQITPYKTKGGMQTNGRKFFRLTMGDISKMEGMLTKRQKDVCKALQGFMQETGAKWGNEVTLRRWGIKKFGEKDYYPIKVVQRILHSTKDSSGQNQEYRLINLGASKETKPGANIAVAVSSIFDTYSDHMAEMARYNALALPVVDAMRWFNHTVLDENGVKVQTVNNAMQQAFGAPACDYFRKLIQDLNSNTTGENDMATGFARKMLRNYKAAVIAYNLGTVLKQPLSYVKAGYVLKQKHLIRAFGKIEGEGKKKFRQEREQMLEHSGMALWKDLGFYSPDIGPGLKHMIKQDQSWHDKQVEFGMKGAGEADMLTMTRLWIACKWQVAEESKTSYGNVDLQKVKSLFNEVIFKTQVVDSTITRTQQMRQTGLWQAMNTAFGGEPTTAMNMLMEGYYEYQDEKRRSGKKNAWQKSKGKLTRGIAVYTFASVAEAIVSSLIDAWRDDDEYQNYWEKYLEALFGKYGLDGNLLGSWLPHNKVFFLKDIVNALSNGGKTNRMDLDGLVNLGKQAGALLESFRLMVGLQDKPTELTGYGKKTWYGLAYDTLKVMGQVSGMGEYNVIRTGKTAWNNAANTWNALVDGFGWNTRKLGKLRSWDGRTENAVLTAFQEGQLTAEEAAEKLQEVRALKGETAYSQNQLYWKLKKADTGYGSTDELDLAVLSGNQDLIAACVKELEDHSDKKPTEPIKAAILRIYRDSLLPEDERNKLYEGQTIDRAKAEQLLRELTEMEEYEIFTALEKKEYAAAHDGEEGFSVYTKVYEAMLAGEDVAPLYEQLEGEGFHEDQITSGSRTLVRTAYQEGELSREETERILGEYYGITKEKDLYEWFGKADYESQGYGDNYSAYKDVYAAVGQGKDISQAVKELVSHGFEEGQVYEQAVDEVHRLYKEGEISEADAVRLLGTYGRTKAELSKASEEAYKKQYGTLPKEGQQRRLTEHEVFWKAEEWKWKKANPDSAEAYSKYAEFYQAVESGRELKKTIQYYMSHGMTAEQLAGEITRRYKEQYLQLRKEKKFAQAANLAARLLTAWERLGYNRSEMLRKIQKWE